MPTPNSSTRFAIDIGTVIADTYRIDALIGRGGMGAVFVASHLRLPGNRVAIKVLHTGVDDADVMARFKREAEIAARLDHPNIVNVIDVNTTPDGTPYLILEYLRGISLADRIAAGPLPLEQTFRIVRQIGSALAAAHREGIVHRDLKPQNVFLVNPEGENTVEVAKVLDFGISKIRGSQTIKTQDNALLGTPQYMAPEQATGKHESVDERTDIFALGAIVYEMVTGRPAFSGASIPEVVFKVVYEPPAPLPPEVPADVSSAIHRAMAKPAADRFPTIDAFVVALTGTKLSGGRVIIEPPPAPEAFALGSKHTLHSGGAELASTLASGDHGPAASAGTADTIDSAKLPASIAPGSVTISTLSPTSSSSQAMAAANTKATTVATDSRSLWGKVLGIGGGLAAAAIALVVFVNVQSGGGSGGGQVASPARGADTVAVQAEPAPVTRGPTPKPPTEPVAVTTPVTTPDTADATTPDAAPDAKTDAKTDAKIAPAPDAKTPPSRAHLRPPSHAARSASSADDDTASSSERAKLREAGLPDPREIAAARQQGDADTAIAIANKIIASPVAPPGVKQRAIFQRGLTRCKLQQDRPAAMIDYRLLKGGRLATRLARECDLQGD